MSKGEIDKRREARMRAVTERVIATLKEKNPEYGESWKAGGGKTAFENLQRKWSRIKTAADAHDGDIFAALREKPNLVDSLLDLMGYDVLILEDQCVIGLSYGDDAWSTLPVGLFTEKLK